MTREERERFIRNTIAEFGFDKDGVRRIADKWDDDVDDARNDGYEAGWREAQAFGGAGVDDDLSH